MKTDLPIYQFLATDPKAFTTLTGIELSDKYQFSVPTLKSGERRIDAMFAPSDGVGPVYVVEFQAQPNPSIRYNLMSKISLYGEQHPGVDVRGVLVFPETKVDKQNFQWQPETGQIAVVYLEENFPSQRIEESADPFILTLAPLLIEDNTILKQLAPKCWQIINNPQLDPQIRNNLGAILQFWFMERFKAHTAQEIANMLHVLTPLEETRAYKELVAKGEARGRQFGLIEGEARGEARGKIKGQLELLKRQLAKKFGKLSKAALKKLDAATPDQLEAWAEGILDTNSVEELLR
ncbi:hypothetical protein TI04_03130 [Achromatium sp. WMS2]|nr:hypothetical protein TI04_03130 [Achromatium sp. WMS2]